MARTEAGAELTQQHRLAQLAIRAELVRQIAQLWPLFDLTDFSTFDAFGELAALLVQAHHRDSAGLAAAYFEAFRRAEGIPGSVPLAVPAAPAVALVAERLRAAGLLGVLNARRAGQSLTAASRNGFIRLVGSASTLALEGGRTTLMDAVAEDPESARWQRVTSGKPCAFCAMLASRGAVYRSETADFQAHDHCSCVPEPVYRGSAPPPASERFRDEWETSTAGERDQLNAFRRAFEGEPT